MPRRTISRKHRGRGQRMAGKGFWSFLKKAGAFLKRHKVLSRVGSALGTIGVPYAGAAGKIGGAVGYGRRRKIRSGRGLHRAGRSGNGLRLAGSRRCR